MERSNQNGNYPSQYESVYSDAPNNGFDQSWTFDPAASSAAQSTSSYSNWQQTPVSNPSLDSYGHSYNQTSAFPQHLLYNNFGDHRQLSNSPYDPSLVAANTTEHRYGFGHSPYGQQPATGATIAPHALENDQSRTLSTPQPFNQQVCGRRISLLEHDE